MTLLTPAILMPGQALAQTYGTPNAGGQNYGAQAYGAQAYGAQQNGSQSRVANLQWRRSAKIKPQSHHVPTTDVFADDADVYNVKRNTVGDQANQMRSQQPLTTTILITTTRCGKLPRPVTKVDLAPKSDVRQSMMLLNTAFAKPATTCRRLLQARNQVN